MTSCVALLPGWVTQRSTFLRNWRVWELFAGIDRYCPTMALELYCKDVMVAGTGVHEGVVMVVVGKHLTFYLLWFSG